LPGVGSDSGAFDLYNGALGEFDNACNVELYAADNANAFAPTADLLGTGDATTALETGTVTGAFESFLQAGLSDLTAYFEPGALTSLF
jgi:hypothetical protein